MLSKEDRIKKIQITVDRFVALLAEEHELCAINFGGVNNWDWHWQAIIDYIQEYVDNHPGFLKAVREPDKINDYVLDDIDFRKIAEYETEIMLENMAEEEASTP